LPINIFDEGITNFAVIDINCQIFFKAHVNNMGLLHGKNNIIIKIQNSNVYDFCNFDAKNGKVLRWLNFRGNHDHSFICSFGLKGE
jgi:hypothetical protein